MNRKKFSMLTVAVVGILVYVFKDKISPFVNQIKSKINL